MERLRYKFSLAPDYQNAQAEQDPKYGEVLGVPVFATFARRDDLKKSNVHNQQTAGIAGNTKDGAYSIVLSNGYEDDVDEGDFISYTGTGGKDGDVYGRKPNVTFDQSFEHQHNRALQISAETKRPVRVIRGPHKHSKYAPETGYRYDGLYIVEKAYMSKSKNGFQVCKYDLRRLPGQGTLPVRGV
ncbi:PUA-like domain-containing protein [Amanita rubescens]|nr:PUA-like domain-containing protein [Amanita rubescens]